MNRPRRKGPPATHDDDRRASRGYDDTSGDEYRGGDDNRRRSPRPAEIDDYGYDYHQALVRWVLDRPDLLTEWERRFCVSLMSFPELSKLQWDTLRGIADKVELGRGVFPNRRARR